MVKIDFFTYLNRTIQELKFEQKLKHVNKPINLNRTIQELKFEDVEWSFNNIEYLNRTIQELK